MYHYVHNKKEYNLSLKSQCFSICKLDTLKNYDIIDPSKL